MLSTTAYIESSKEWKWQVTAIEPCLSNKVLCQVAHYCSWNLKELNSMLSFRNSTPLVTKWDISWAVGLHLVWIVNRVQLYQLILERTFFGIGPKKSWSCLHLGYNELQDAKQFRVLQFRVYREWRGNKTQKQRVQFFFFFGWFGSVEKAVDKKT